MNLPTLNGEEPVAMIAVFPTGEVTVMFNQQIVCSDEREVWLWHRMMDCLTGLKETIREGRAKLEAMMTETAPPGSKPN